MTREEALKPQAEAKSGKRTPADGSEAPVDEEYKVEDRRHWTVEDDKDVDDPTAEVEPARPTLIDEYRTRAEAAEKKLQEYIEAFKSFQQEQEDFRARMSRDVERRVALGFGELIARLVPLIDDLDLGLSHVSEVSEAEPLAKGVSMARDRFLAALEQHGVTRVSPTGEEFDPNDTEAMRVDPVDDPGKDGRVTETLQPGYKLGERVIRPARVAVGRYDSSRA